MLGEAPMLHSLQVKDSIKLLCEPFQKKEFNINDSIVDGIDIDFHEFVGDNWNNKLNRLAFTESRDSYKCFKVNLSHFNKSNENISENMKERQRSSQQLLNNLFTNKEDQKEIEECLQVSTW